MFTDEPVVMEGYYRLSGPAISGNQKSGLSLARVNGFPVDKYVLDYKDRLPASELKFKDTEPLLMRPRKSEFYFGDVEEDEFFEMRGELPGAPKHDPESEFPNRWEIEETVRYALSRDFHAAAIRFKGEYEWKMTAEQQKDADETGVIVCPCQLNSDPKNRILLHAVASITYLNKR